MGYFPTMRGKINLQFSSSSCHEQCKYMPPKNWDLVSFTSSFQFHFQPRKLDAIYLTGA